MTTMECIHVASSGGLALLAIWQLAKRPRNEAAHVGRGGPDAAQRGASHEYERPWGAGGDAPRVPADRGVRDRSVVGEAEATARAGPPRVTPAQRGVWATL